MGGFLIYLFMTTPHTRSNKGKEKKPISKTKKKALGSQPVTQRKGSFLAVNYTNQKRGCVHGASTLSIMKSR